ncbi:ABC transporter permease [Streptomyces shenzhenensis]|uniref:ABC transporter permease n=1 Tax=Streptomyces shenzhenensis TaxID=943815 RepID=UPI0033D9CEA6
MTTHQTAVHPLTRLIPRLPRTTLVRFLLVRLSALVGLLLVLSLMLFVLQEISGADPVAAVMQHASPQAVAAKRHELGLDAPAPVRYLRYLGNLVHLDFGTSFRTSNPVLSDIRTYLPPTVELVLFALVGALLLALLFAVSSVLRWPGGLIYRSALFLASAAPAFLLGILGLIVFYQDLGWFPASGRVSNPDAVPGEWHWLLFDSLVHGDLGLFGDTVEHLVLPAFALAIHPALAIGRILRSSIGSALESDYVRTARSKGLKEPQVVVRHVLRNSVNGALSMTGLHLGFMFAGVLVVEAVFSRPGLGSYLGASLGVSDFPAVAGVTFVLATIYIVGNTAVDILQRLADPRITL